MELMLLAFLLQFGQRIMDDTPVKRLDEIRREYILRVLSEVDWDYKKASAILKVSEKSLKRQIRSPSHDHPPSK
jgi:hypothetical protein